MSLLSIFIVAISLSMDAFSLALLYGTLNLDKKVIRMISLTVGIFHFFMPLIGYLFGDMLSFFLTFNANLLVGTIFLVLAVEMVLSLRKEETVSEIVGFFSYLLFGFTVSIDSFSIGIGIGSLNGPVLLPCILFSLVSATFTYFGLLFGKSLASRYGKYSVFFGSILLFLLALHHIF